MSSAIIASVLVAGVAHWIVIRSAFGVVIRGVGGNERSVAAIAGLAEGIQGLVKNMRNEQQMLRDWIEAQQEDARAMRKTLDRLNDKISGAK